MPLRHCDLDLYRVGQGHTLQSSVMPVLITLAPGAVHSNDLIKQLLCLVILAQLHIYKLAKFR